MRKYLKNVRHYGHPTLKDVNGLLNLVVLSFGWFNLLLGAALFLQSAETNEFFIVSGIFSYQFWGSAFFLGGLVLLWAHWLNYWALMRKILIAMLFIKIVWLAALLTRQFVDPAGNTFLLLFFSLATAAQAGAYIYFPILERPETWKE